VGYEWGKRFFKLSLEFLGGKIDHGDMVAGHEIKKLMAIDACKPFHWRDRFARANKFSAEKREEIWEKWAPKLGLK